MSDTQSQSKPLIWGSVTDVKKLEANSVVAAKTVASIFGESSASIAAWCAVHARQDGDEPGYRLWLSAFKHIVASDLNVQS